MNKKLLFLIITTMAMSLVACSKSEPAEDVAVVESELEEKTISKEDEVTPTPEVTQAPEEEKKEEKEEKEEPTPTLEVTKEVEDGLQIDWDNIEKFAEAKTMYVQKNVNIRKGPDTSFDKVGSFKINDEVTVIGKSKKDSWYEIQYKDDIAFVHSGFVGEEQVDLEALKAAQEAEAMALIEQQRAAEAAAQQNANAQQTQTQATQPAVQTPVQAPAGVLFIGDSRSVQMQAAVGGYGTWICEGGKRYEWFAETAIPKADACVGKGTKVVICMGVNDPWAYDKYAALANAKAAEWAGRGAKVYFVSVNPVWENPYVTQEQVDNFNANMPGLLSGVRWIDTASVLKANGYRLVDGLHYDADTYVYIFNLIAGSLK